MTTRRATAHWEGQVKDGSGHITAESGAVNADYSFGARFEKDPGTNPEELLGAAHAGCFTMALSLALTEAGHTPSSIDTTADVTIEAVPEGFAITNISLNVKASVPGLDASEFVTYANAAKDGCPVSKALAATDISLEAQLS